VDAEQRQEAIFGAFDGVVSIIGFVFGMLVHKSPESAMAIGGLGGAISASISMGVGEIEKGDEPWHNRLDVGLAMFLSTLVGSLVPVWPFFVWGKSTGMIVSAIGCLVVATWIGYEKRRGWRGFANAYTTLVLAAGLTLLIVSFIPQSAG
jgi:VIT1/CCC1 family predicted Fe2+/Mn2+ transporter